MLFIDTPTFFSQFQINYFDYKQSSLKFLLENYSLLNLEDRILGYKEDDYILAIKSDIRQTYFQAIETVFEIFFALLPEVNTPPIIKKLTQPNTSYDRISIIGQDENALNFLDDQIEKEANHIITIGEDIFYYGLYKHSDLRERINTSISAIKYAFRTIAKDISDRSEYNSYKHGMRIFPTLSTLEIIDINTKESLSSWDLKDSLSYYSINKNSNKESIVTKLLDTERDFHMTSLCSNLLWSMIKLKDYAFNKQNKTENSSVEVLFYTDEYVTNALKTNVKIQNLRISFTDK